MNSENLKSFAMCDKSNLYYVVEYRSYVVNGKKMNDVYVYSVYDFVLVTNMMIESKINVYDKVKNFLLSR